MRVRIATRGSPLARWQAEHVGALLRVDDASIDVELVIVETLGDRTRDRPIHELGGQGVFVKEVQSAVLEGHADVAVHSAKDLPSMPAPGLVIAAVPERGDARDALVGRALADLGPGATVATGSVRRRAQLAHLRPDLEFVELRGNIQTRLSKVPTDGALVMAVAALDRLGLGAHIAQALDPSVMLPQVAQGALAVECRDDDAPTRELLSRIEHAPSRARGRWRARVPRRARRRLRPSRRRARHRGRDRAGGARASSPTSLGRPCCATRRSAAIRSRWERASRRCCSTNGVVLPSWPGPR